MKRLVYTSQEPDAHGYNAKGQTWQEFLDWYFYEGFDPSGLSDEEYYDLEDTFYSIEASSKVTASQRNSPNADEYVVKIWHEVDGAYRGNSSAAEEVFFIVADNPSQALERAKNQWSGPIDRIEIVDINPELEDFDEAAYSYSYFD